MLYLDAQYLNLVSHKLSLFKKVKDYTYKFRCPYCNDSQKSKVKVRGFIYRKQNDLFFKCFNCPESHTFQNFLKHLDHTLYTEYTMERWSNKVGSNKGNYHRLEETKNLGSAPVFKSKPKQSESFYGLSSIHDLDDDHECKQYVINRKIPKYIWKKLFYTDNFKKFGEEFSEREDTNLPEDRRLVIPFYLSDGSVDVVQGRSLEKNPFLRYLTLKKNDDCVKVYGEDRIDPSKEVRVVEGPIDSLFVFNCVGSADANLMSVSERYENRVLIFDNQPRNPQLVRIIGRAVAKGEKVCFMPGDAKDINDMYKDGMSVKDIDDLIRNNTYQGIEADLMFSEWKKV